MSARLLSRLCAAALALAPVAADAYFVPRHAAPLPGLVDRNSYTPACNRFGFFTNGATETATLSFLGHTHCVSPTYATDHVRIVVSNFIVWGDGRAAPEACPSKMLTVDFATIFISGVAYPVTFGGQTSIALANCQAAISDPLRDASGNIVSLPAQTTYYVRISRTLPAGGGVMPTTGAYSVNPVAANSYAGGLTDDGFGGYSTPQTALRLSGTVPAGNGVGSFSSTPTMVVAQGWDGTPVYGIFGDSIGYGYEDADYRSAYTTGSGAIQRALWDAASGRRNFQSFAIPGTAPDTQASIAVGQWAYRVGVLRLIGNLPFNQIISNMGQNSPQIGGGALAQWKIVEGQYWAFLHGLCPGCHIYQVTFPSHAGTTNSLLRMTTQAEQTSDYPNGARWLAGAWLAANAGLPSYVTGVDLTTAFTTGSGFTDNPGNWPTTPWSGTLAAAWSSGKSVSVSAATAPLFGALIVFDPGVSGHTQSCDVMNVTGSASPWTVALDCNPSPAHALGEPISLSLTGDGSGTHPGAPLYEAAAQALIALKGTVLP